MTLKRCAECGLPLRLSQRYIWPGNGVILARSDPTSRMIVFEADYYAHVWSELEELLGVNMSELMVRGQQAATQDYLESLIMYGWRKLAMRHLPMSFAFKRTVTELALFGFAALELLEYKHGKLMVIRVKHPFDIISIAWGMKGSVELIEGMGSELAWKREGDDYVVTIIFHTGRDSDAADLEVMRHMRNAKRELSLGGKMLPPQGDQGEPRPKCGLPRALTELEWDEKEGTIHRRDNNLRYIFTTGHIFLGMVKELEKRTGRELAPLIIRISKEYHLKRLQGIPIRTRNGAYRNGARYLFAGGVWKRTETGLRRGLPGDDHRKPVLRAQAGRPHSGDV